MGWTAAAAAAAAVATCSLSGTAAAASASDRVGLQHHEPEPLEGSGTSDASAAATSTVSHGRSLRGPRPGAAATATSSSADPDDTSYEMDLIDTYPQLPRLPKELKRELNMLDGEDYPPFIKPDWFVDLDGPSHPSNDYQYYLPPTPPMQARIVGGKAVGDVSKYPFSVSLHREGLHWCGGVLVGPQVIQTAGHCCNSQGRKGADEVIMQTIHKNGDDATSTIGIRREIMPEKCVTHNGYVERGYLFDVCLCPFEDDPVDPAVLAPIEVNADNNFPLDKSLNPAIQGTVSKQDFTVMGWGSLDEAGKSTEWKMEVDVAYVDQATCLRAFNGRYVMSDMFCAISPGQDACQGDSGGPLVHKRSDGTHLLVGTVSWGYGCADPHYPGVYSRCSAYFPWLKDTICSLSTSTDPKFWPPSYLQCPGKEGRRSLDTSTGAPPPTVAAAAPPPPQLLLRDCRHQRQAILLHTVASTSTPSTVVHRHEKKKNLAEAAYLPTKTDRKSIVTIIVSWSKWLGEGHYVAANHINIVNGAQQEMGRSLAHLISRNSPKTCTAVKPGPCDSEG
eukprot:CAMPEP_0178720184 /NCGR_PEP_ID=MMETSP0699-20121125/23571_1 /TAXON_ID=265572 /ORGANISM="Extubocellulus spinifer, Strain CCMP396" /LENGTH=560 /DNA_ID=CAMNT_0020370567 /DNA_START=117 /DNA_END=1801 /DNA_ORIENTATION=-